MNYGELKTYVRDVLHRDDLTDARMDTWVELATKRLERIITMPENEFDETVTLTPDVNYPNVSKGNLSSNNLAIKTVTANGNIIYQTTFERLVQRFGTSGGGQPALYAIRNDLYVGPGAGSAIITFKAGLGDLVNDSDTNTLLNLQPKLYTWAMLLEAATFSQDGDLLAFASEGLDQEVLVVNRAGDERRLGAAPQMIRG